jgi:hypothetical protein
MAAFTKQFLSASTDGTPIVVGSTTSPGDTVHETPAVTSSTDEVVLYACSRHTGDVTLTLEIGGDGQSFQSPVVLSPGTGQVLVLAGVILRNGKSVKAFADVAGVVSIWGHANRIA